MQALIIGIIGIALHLLSLAFFLGFYFGVFKEFKKETEKSLARLESVYFSDVKIIRKDQEISPVSIREKQ
ncbi:MAG TPA: hypothetical protein VHA33_29170 [Candidatus Angelobacter sp.]|jgi:hypothetical protein|nr:hypothetical protein [Candidatus Angelobacter sp.]